MYPSVVLIMVPGELAGSRRSATYDPKHIASASAQASDRPMPPNTPVFRGKDAPVAGTTSSPAGASTGFVPPRIPRNPRRHLEDAPAAKGPGFGLSDRSISHHARWNSKDRISLISVPASAQAPPHTVQLRWPTLEEIGKGRLPLKPAFPSQISEKPWGPRATGLV